jgi:benzoylformate decarboxylase
MAALGDVLPAEGIVVNESPSNMIAFRNQVRPSHPSSYFTAAGGGLGFGLPAAVGVQLGKPDRPVVAVIGDGSLQYAVAGLWSAVAYDVPLTVLVLRNEEYAILKWFADVEEVTGAPGLDLPAVNTTEIAAGYGVSARRVAGNKELREALSGAIASEQPELVEVPVTPGMALF